MSPRLFRWLGRRRLSPVSIVLHALFVLVTFAFTAGLCRSGRKCMPQAVLNEDVHSVCKDSLFFERLEGYAAFHRRSVLDPSGWGQSKFLVFSAPRKHSGGAADQIKGLCGAFAVALCSERVFLVDDWALKKFFYSRAFDYDMDSYDGLRDYLVQPPGDRAWYYAIDYWDKTEALGTPNFEETVFSDKQVVGMRTNLRVARRMLMNSKCMAPFENLGLLEDGIERTLVDGLLLRALLEPIEELRAEVRRVFLQSSGLIFGVHVRLGMPKLRDHGFVSFEGGLRMLDCAFERGSMLGRDFSIFLSTDNASFIGSAVNKFGGKVFVSGSHLGHVDRGKISSDILFGAAVDMVALWSSDFLILCNSGFGLQAGWHSLRPYVFHPNARVRGYAEPSRDLGVKQLTWCQEPVVCGTPLPEDGPFLWL